MLLLELVNHMAALVLKLPVSYKLSVMM